MTFCGSKERFVQNENELGLMIANTANTIINTTGIIVPGNFHLTLEQVKENLINQSSASPESGTGLISQVQVLDAVWNAIFPFIVQASRIKDATIKIDRIESQTERGEQIVCYKLSSSITDHSDFTEEDKTSGFPIQEGTPNPFPSPETPPIPGRPTTELPGEPEEPRNGNGGLPFQPPTEQEPPRPGEPGRPPRVPPRDSGFPVPQPEIPEGEEPEFPPDEGENGEEVVEDERDEEQAETEEEKTNRENQEILNKILAQLEETERQNVGRVRALLDATLEQVGSILEAIHRQERVIEDAVSDAIDRQEGIIGDVLRVFEEGVLGIVAGLGEVVDSLNGWAEFFLDTTADSLDRLIDEKQTASMVDNTEAIKGVGDSVDKIPPVITIVADAISTGIKNTIQTTKDIFALGTTFVTDAFTIELEDITGNICKFIEFYKNLMKDCGLDKKEDK